DAAICYDYDEAGNRTAKTEGNQETRYRYDSLNRLTEVRRRTGTDGTETLIARYGYDPQNRRLWKEQYWDRTGQALNPARRTYYLYADEGLIAEAEQDISLGQDGSLTAAGQPQITKQYGIKPGNPFTTGLLFVKTKDTRGETTFAYYHHDHLGVPLQATDRQPA
ncbi:MAG: RHS repeat protein, partial [Candidatus Accumulibacter sp.]|nr:RHS repeat protein [Accumulibacter sp.]